jgi:superfamily II DNA or RNA helicase
MSDIRRSANRKRPSLRPYQRHDLDRIEAEFNGGIHRVCYQAPTGSGKTVLFADLIRQVAHDWGEPALVLTHKDEIMQQVSESLHDLDLRHGIIAPGYPETPHRVQVASVMTLVRRLDRLRRHPPSLAVIDETHHAKADTWERIISVLPRDTMLLGVTATPRRLDGKPLDDIFQKLIIGPSIAQLIDDGYLAPCTVFTPPTGPDLSRVQIRAGDYRVEQLAEVMADGIIVSSAVDEYVRLCSGAPGIAFCVNIAHSQLVAQAFIRRGFRAAHVDGDTPRQQRRELIAALGSGDLDVLCNCGLISEGLDVPGVVAAILLRPTRSLSLYLQMVGRALRPAEGKELAYVLDHAGNVLRHGLPTARRRWTLHGKQQPDGAADSLMRCPHCGAVNERTDEFCTHCGGELHQRREPKIEITGPRLVEAVEAPISDADLHDMTYRAALRWAADDLGYLRPERLQRIARARGFKDGWVWHLRDKHWEQVWQETLRWRQQQP